MQVSELQRMIILPTDNLSGVVSYTGQYSKEWMQWHKEYTSPPPPTGITNQVERGKGKREHIFSFSFIQTVLMTVRKMADRGPCQYTRKSPSSAAHTLSLGFTNFGEIFIYVVLYYPNMEAVTFCLHGWCMLVSFFLLAFMSRTWMAGSFESMWWNVYSMNKLDLNL